MKIFNVPSQNWVKSLTKKKYLSFSEFRVKVRVRVRVRVS